MSLRAFCRRSSFTCKPKIGGAGFNVANQNYGTNATLDIDRLKGINAGQDYNIGKFAGQKKCERHKKTASWLTDICDACASLDKPPCYRQILAALR